LRRQSSSEEDNGKDEFRHGFHQFPIVDGVKAERCNISSPAPGFAEPGG
jgi:hypothetical protein